MQYFSILNKLRYFPCGSLSAPPLKSIFLAVHLRRICCREGETERIRLGNETTNKEPYKMKTFLIREIVKFLTALSTVFIVHSASGITRWKGETSGFWDVSTNWAGGFPSSTTNVQLDHQNQASTYTVVVQGAALTDKLWLQNYGDIPVRVTVNATGDLQLYNLRLGGSLTDRETSFTIDGGTVTGLGPVNAATGTTTSFLIGDNSGCDATMMVSNGGSLSILGVKDLTIASGAESTGHLIVTNGTVQVSDSLVIGKGQGSSGELLVSGTSSISVTGSLQVAKSELGALAATGVVSVAGGLLECGAINIGANGNGTFTLTDGEVRALAGGIVLGREGFPGRLNVDGGTLETVASSLSLGQTSSSGFLTMTDGVATVDGDISVGAASQGAGAIDLSGGAINTQQLVVGAATTGTGTVNISGGSLNASTSIQIGLIGSGTLTLEDGLLSSTSLAVGPGVGAACHLLGGELVLNGLDNDSIQISSGVVHIEQTLVKWANSNVTAWVTDAVARDVLTWSDGVAAGTYSSNGFDGRLVNGTTALYWDNLDNGSQFDQSALWVEQLSAEELYDVWAADNGLSGTDAEPTANPDYDQLVNLAEYALGGNPNDTLDTGILPTRGFVEADGTKWFEYVYRRRTDAVDRGLIYVVELSTKLEPDGWSDTGYTTTDPVPDGDGFEAVTNRVSAGAYSTLFMRLQITLGQ